MSRLLGSSITFKIIEVVGVELRKIRRANRRHDSVLADTVKENPKSVYKYIRCRRVTRERIGLVKGKQVIYVRIRKRWVRS